MTVPAIEPVKNHYGNGSNTQFDFDFFVENPSQLKVIKTNASKVDTVLEYGVDYDIDGIGNVNGGYVTFPISTSEHNLLKSDEVLSIQLDLPISQESEYGASDKLNLNAIEYSFDYATRIIQMIARQIKRCVKVTEGSGIDPDKLINEIMEAAETSTLNSKSAKNSAQNAYNYLDNCVKLLQSTRDLIQKIENQTDSGYFFDNNYSMFSLIYADKALLGKELVGLSKQNELNYESDYPDAYLELFNDYSSGENKLYTDDDMETYYKSYTGDITGNFYIQSSDNLEVGTDIYKPIFDISKFTKAGNPTVTDDGILSQTDNSNYLAVSVTYNSVSRIRATVKFNTGALDKTAATQLYETIPFSLYIQYVQSSGNFYPMMRISDGTNNFSLRTSTVALSQNTDYYAIFSYDIQTKQLSIQLYDASYNLIDSITSTSTNTIVLADGTYTATLGRGSNISTNFNQDLKFLTIETNGTLVFSGEPDINLIGKAGTITSASETNSKKYSGEIKDFYTDAETELDIDTLVYEDKGLISPLGSVQNIKQVTAYKYTSSKTGSFYLDSQIRKGAKIYSDVALTVQTGTITNTGVQKADKYQINTLGECYVAENSTLGVGTKIYSDVARTQLIGTVTAKGSVTSSYLYYYYLHGGAGNDAMFGAGPNGMGWVNPFYVYSKQPVSSQVQNIPVYWDSACTSSAGYFDRVVSNGYFQFKAISDKISMVAPKYVDLISQSGSGNSSYIQINNSSEKLEFIKLGTDSVDVISVNTEPNETFQLDDYLEGVFIKIENVEWQKYNEPISEYSAVISVDSAENENVTYNGLETVQGIAFEYKEAQDGHKIVDIKYKNALEAYIDSEGKSDFYLIDIDEKTFTTPIFDADKNIYICVGNTQAKKAQINTVTKAELTDALKNCAKEYDVKNILALLEYTDGILNEIVGE